MPHTSSTQSLEELCCRNIGKNMDNLWCRDYNENIHGKGEYLYLIGPFSNLPGVLLSKLILYLKTHNLLKIAHLQLLLDCSLQELDLSRLSNNMGLVINTIVNRCVNLRHLDLSGNSKLPLRGQIALFSTARQLETINLSHTNTSDRVMSVIGAYCLQLSELNVSHSAVSDWGLTSLSTAAPCQSTCAGAAIRTLAVDGCDVTHESAFAVINSMSGLTSFDHAESVPAVERLVLLQPERAPLALTELRGSSAAGLDVAVQACPRTETLHLHLADGGDSLAPAAQLTRLATLVVTCAAEPCAGLADVLRACGDTLTELTLTAVARVPARLLLRDCPALRRLGLFECSFDDAPPPAGPPPAQLERLWMLQPTDQPAPAPLLRRLLAAPRLRHVGLHRCDALTDDMLEVVLEEGGLHQLRTLGLEDCNSVGAQVLHALVVQCACLEEVALRRCQLLSRRDAAEIRRTAADNGWRLTLHWL